MKTPVPLFLSFMLLAGGACSSDPEEANQPVPSEVTPATDDEQPVTSLAETVPLDSPVVKIDDQNTTAFTATWQDPTNWGGHPQTVTEEDTRSDYPIHRVEVSTDPAFSAIIFSKDFQQEYSIRIKSLKTGQRYFLRVTSLPPEGDDRFLPSRPTILSLYTLSGLKGQPSGLIITPGIGTVSVSWQPTEAEDRAIQYHLEIFEDEAFANGIYAVTTQLTKVEDHPLQAEREYWVRLRSQGAPGNDVDPLSDPLASHFYVPGNFLSIPDNLSAETVGDDVKAKWDPVENNLGPILYLLSIHVGDELTQLYGEHELTETFQTMEDSKSYGTFSFSLKTVPQEGNLKDIESDATSLRYDMPTRSYESLAVATFVPDPNEPSMLTASWTPPADADEVLRYEIEIAEDGNFSAGHENRIEDGNMTTAEFTGRELGKTYFFRVRSIGPEGDATHLPSEWSPTRQFAMPAPPAPVEFNATDEKASLP